MLTLEFTDTLAPDAFPAALGALLKNIHRQQNEALKPFGLSSLHAGYLMLLYRHEQGLSMRRLTELGRVDKANTSRAIGSLEEKGYATRIDVPGRQSSRIALTELGRRAALAANRGTDRVLRMLQDGLTTEEMHSFDGLLQKMLRMIDES